MRQTTGLKNRTAVFHGRDHRRRHIGTEVTHPRMFDNRRYELTDNVSITKGRHSIRFGVDGNITPSRQLRETFMAGRYDFKSLADFNAGKISRYRGTCQRTAIPIR